MTLRRASCFPLLLSLGIAASCTAFDDDGARDDESLAALALAPGLAAAGSTSATAVAAHDSGRPALTAAERAAEDSIYRVAAAAAWRFIDRNHVPRTGLVRPFDHYEVATMWDVAGGLAATFSAHELGLLPRPDYDRRMSRALQTLASLPLFEGVFNKEYRVDNGAIIGISRAPSKRGYGASATDHGRLLLWLRIVANRHPQHRAAVERVIARLDLGRLVDDGYLQGRQLSRRTGRTREFQEGRIGYEQYAAHGFAAWGLRAEKALDLREHLEPKTVEGIHVPGDERGGDRLTSEPFVLLGLESGWASHERMAAYAVLGAQEGRYRRTGTLTMVSEDAINRAPDYFFYYTVLSSQGPWSIEVQRPNVRVSEPRWLSAKAAFGWHALVGSRYTRTVLDTIAERALVNGVWGSGIFENGRPTGNPNINTAAVVLEAALYRRVRTPFARLAAAPAVATR